MLEQKLVDEKAAYLKSAYDIVFEDNAIKEEQRSTTLWFKKSGNEGGREWSSVKVPYTGSIFHLVVLGKTRGTEFFRGGAGDVMQGCFGMRAPALHSASRAKRELKIKPWLTP